jgi:hypothetical protein
VVGAGVLAIGLFRSSEPLLLGWSRDPLQAAADYAFGVTGFLFLASGFALQSLPLFGVHASKCGRTAALVAAGGLVGGAAVAWIACEVLRVYFFRGEKAYAARSYQPFKASLRFKPGVEKSGRWPVPRLWQMQVEEE